MARLFGLFFVFAGLMHFLKTRWYERIMPPYLPRHRELVYASGVAEIAGGLATMHPGWPDDALRAPPGPAAVHRLGLRGRRLGLLAPPSLWAWS